MFSPESIVGSEALIDNQKFSNVSAMPKKASKVYETRSRNNFSKSFNNKTNIIVQRKQLKTTGSPSFAGLNTSKSYNYNKSSGRNVGTKKY